MFLSLFLFRNKFHIRFILYDKQQFNNFITITFARERISSRDFARRRPRRENAPLRRSNSEAKFAPTPTGGDRGTQRDALTSELGNWQAVDRWPSTREDGETVLGSTVGLSVCARHDW